MAIRKLISISVACAVAMLATMFHAVAFDPDRALEPGDTPQIILRYGYNALKDGRHEDAVGAFRLGADKNHLPAQWKLARMLETGNGVQKNPAAAYTLYEKIADRYAEIPPNRIDMPYVASAVVALGRYSLLGIEGTRVKRDAHQAEFHFYRAGALYGDAEAQYQLAMLYDSKLLGKPRPRNAARWYELASKKGHAKAQAELGDMLLKGRGVRKNRVLAMVYLTRAAAGSARNGFARISKKQREAFQSASVAQRKAAQKMLERLKLRIPGSQVQNEGQDLRLFGLSTRAADVERAGE